MFVNPFNGRNDCSKYDSKELEIAYNIYRGELLEFVPVQHVQISESEEYDSAHFQVNQNQLANLKRHSAYYNDYFTKHTIDDSTDGIWIPIEKADYFELNKDEYYVFLRNGTT